MSSYMHDHAYITCVWMFVIIFVWCRSNIKQYDTVSLYSQGCEIYYYALFCSSEETLELEHTTSYSRVVRVLKHASYSVDCDINNHIPGIVQISIP